MLNRYFNSQDNPDLLYANIVLKNIHFALIALEYIFDDHNYNTGIYHDEHTYYFYHIQSLLTACGNISNVFYNTFSGNTACERSKRLRNLFDVSKTKYPLIFQKEVRNTNEHFDERYEQFNNCIGDYNILDENTDEFMRTIITQNPHLRTYDKKNKIYITYNRQLKRIEYNLQTLKKELFELQEEITSSNLFIDNWISSIENEQVT
ncbi:MAG: hypothetical protein ACI4KI_00335 [Candidatus Fimenecus sp.]